MIEKRSDSASLYIILPIHNAEKFLPACLSSLQAQSYRDFQLVVIDDGSSDGSREAVRTFFPSARILQGDGSYWWTKCINLGICEALNDQSCRAVLLLNPDTVAVPGYLASIMRAHENHPNAVFGSAIYDITNDKPYDLGWVVNWLTGHARNNLHSAAHLDGEMLKVSVVSGRGMLIPRSVLVDVGLLNEKAYPQYYSDGAFSVAARRRGSELFVCSDAILHAHVRETGIEHFAARVSLSGFWGYLTSIKSPGNLAVRIKGAFDVAPTIFKPSYVVMDTLRSVLRYFTYSKRVKR